MRIRHQRLLASGLAYGLVAVMQLAVMQPATARPVTPSASAVTCPAPTTERPQPWLDASLTPECRTSLVLAQLPTQAERLAFVQSFGGFHRPSKGEVTIARRLGLELGRSSDGPAGPRGGMAWPNPLTIGASFDVDAAARYGDAIAQDFRRMGFAGMLGPILDVPRSWRFGRMSEDLSEDPVLTARLGVAEIRAAQERDHLLVMMKHFPAYTQEQGRVGDQPAGRYPAVNAQVSERVLREVYLPTFQAAVEEAHVAQVMCSFPRINGVYACENPFLLNVLKKEWGFDGSVYPDSPDAQRSIIPAINAGLDGGRFEPTNGGLSGVTYIPGPSLLEGLNSGSVSRARLEDLMRRRLMPVFRVGALDHPPVAEPDRIGSPAALAEAARLITEGTVLLRNQGDILPFGPNVRSVALIGTQAGPGAFVTSQGSGYVEPKRLVAVDDAMRVRAGDAIKVTWTQGDHGVEALPPAPATMFRTPDGRPGVRVEYFADPSLSFAGAPIAVRDAETPAFLAPPKDIPNLPKDGRFAVRWTGSFVPTTSGAQLFTLRGAGSARLYLDDRLVAQYWRSDFGDIAYAAVPMTGGKPARIRVEFTPREAFNVGKLPVPTTFMGGLHGGTLELGWAGPDDRIADAVAAARKADVAVVAVGIRQGEGMDRHTLALPAGDDALIEAVAQANPRTVVLVTAGGPIAMPWLDRVAAVMMMWLPGDSFGTAAAQLLFGDAAPAGRLPVTFPRDEQQGPQTTERSYPGLRAPDGSLDTVHFDEGLNVGYRYWDAHGQQPLFPFGFGLSYTRFTLSNGRVTAQPSGGATVEIDVRNTGARAGAEVVQAYLAYPRAAGEPPKQLRSFAKVMLQPGEQRRVQLRLDRPAFEYWDEKQRGWTVARGAYRVEVGSSSRDIAFVGEVTPR